jgi:hypothetical protein
MVRSGVRMFWLLLSCSQRDEVVSQIDGDRVLHIVYGQNMDGEIEPCG